MICRMSNSTYLQDAILGDTAQRKYNKLRKVLIGFQVIDHSGKEWNQVS